MVGIIMIAIVNIVFISLAVYCLYLYIKGNILQEARSKAFQMITNMKADLERERKDREHSAFLEKD
jgi:uncharacterized protein YpmB